MHGYKTHKKKKNIDQQLFTFNNHETFHVKKKLSSQCYIAQNPIANQT